MHYIHSEQCSNEECASATAVVVHPRPTTLSSLWSSFSYTSSVISSTTPLFRGISFRRHHTNIISTTDSNNRTNPVATVSIVPSSMYRGWNRNDPLLFSPLPALPVTPANDLDCFLTYNNNNNLSLSNHYHHDKDIATSVKSSATATPNDYHHQTMLLDTSRQRASDRVLCNDNSTNIVTATIIPTKLPQSCRDGTNDTPSTVSQLIRTQQRPDTVVSTNASIIGSKRQRTSNSNATKKVKKSNAKKLKRTVTTKKSKNDVTLLPPSSSSSPVRSSTAICTNKHKRDSDKDDKSSSLKRKKPTKRRKGLLSSTAVEPTSDNDDDSPEWLDDWQQTFLNFITYPSDHIIIQTGKPVPLRDTIIWGRQKVSWTAPIKKTPKQKQQQQQQQLAVSDANNTNDSVPSVVKRSGRGRIPSKAGGNHLSQQLVVQAAIAAQQLADQKSVTASNDENLDPIVDVSKTTPSLLRSISGMFSASSFLWNTSTTTGTGTQYNVSEYDESFLVNESFLDLETVESPNEKNPSKEILMIRRNNDEALRFHGGVTLNQNFGHWLHNERRSYREFKETTVTVASVATPMPNDNKRRKKLSSQEMEQRYGTIKQSFQFHLLQMIGMDMQSDETMIHGI